MQVVLGTQWCPKLSESAFLPLTEQNEPVRFPYRYPSLSPLAPNLHQSYGLRKDVAAASVQQHPEASYPSR
jgi:hypothetical protein